MELRDADAGGDGGIGSVGLSQFGAEGSKRGSLASQKRGSFEAPEDELALKLQELDRHKQAGSLLADEHSATARLRSVRRASAASYSSSVGVGGSGSVVGSSKQKSNPLWFRYTLYVGSTRSGTLDTIYKGSDDFCELSYEIDEGRDTLTVGIDFLPPVDEIDTRDISLSVGGSKRGSLELKEGDHNAALYGFGKAPVKHTGSVGGAIAG